MTANRRSSGRTSRNSPKRLAAISLPRFDRPVTLPPGRASDVTRPLPIGSPAEGNTIGITDVACFAATAASVPPARMMSTLSRTNSAAISVKRSARPSAVLDRDGATLDPAELAQSLHKGGDPCALACRRTAAQEPNGRQLARLLRACRYWPSSSRAADKRDELAASDARV